MKRWIIRGTLALLIAATLLTTAGYATLRWMGLFRAPAYDTVPPELPALPRPAVLVLYKTNGYIHREAIPAANALFAELAQRRGYSIYTTDNGAIINERDLRRFDVVVWNNNTGDILAPEQRSAFRHWLEGGGRWLGLHSASDNHFSWPWFVDEVIGARFNGATRYPASPRAELVFEQFCHPALANLPDSLWLEDELYSFSTPPRAKVQVLAHLDERTYLNDQGWLADQLRMGDHPIIWWREVGRGIAVYSGIGHHRETYDIVEYRQLLDNTLRWLIGSPASGGDAPAGCYPSP